MKTHIPSVDYDNAASGHDDPQDPSCPEVSVVMPVYKTEKFLRDSVMSVIGQSFQRWQLIIVDDGSPDRCGEMAEAFAAGDQRIEVIHQANAGLSEARNTGLRHVRAPFVTMLDSDDILHPDYLSILVELQKKRKDVISCVGFSFFSHDCKWRCAGLKGDKAQIYSSAEAIEEILYQRSLNHSSCGKLYPAHAVPPGIFTPHIGYEDLDSFYRIFERVKEVIYCDMPLYGYRCNPESYTQVFTPRRRDVLDVAEKMCGVLEKKSYREGKAARSRLLSAYFNIYSLMTVAGWKDEPTRRRCIDGIHRLRLESLLNRKVRMKNKLGIIASYMGGTPLLRLLSRIFY